MGRTSYSVFEILDETKNKVHINVFGILKPAKTKSLKIFILFLEKLNYLQEYCTIQ